MSLAYRLKSAYHSRMANKRKQKSASLGCLFWIAFILLVLVLFFFNRNNISMVLEKTGALNLITGKNTPVETPRIQTEPDIPVITTTTDTNPTVVEPQKATEPKPQKKDDTKKPAETTVAPTAEKPVATAVPQEKPAPTKPVVQTRTATLYFVTIDADGRVVRQEVTREVTRTDSPLSETLNALFSGTTKAETAKKMRTLIPTGTRLISASVKDGVATLNLSEEFQFNQYGIEGFLGQLAQVVFTATAFPTVSSVQILIEGQRREYLGAEGVWIGTPLSRDKF